MDGKPNILFMISHDLGQHLHCYGAETVSSDHLNALAEKGIRFDSVFSTAPQCSPARAAVATGRYPHSNGVMGLAHAEFAWFLPDSEKHVASLLRDHGYQTALIGMQHVTEDPEKIGFQEHIPGSNSKVVGPNAEEWLEKFKREESGKPFYLEIGFEELHRPYSQNGLNDPEASLGTDIPRWLPPYEGSEEEIAAMQGDIFELDRAVGKIIHKLEQLQLMDNTLIIFTADHELDFPRAKGTLYDPGIEIPLIMYYPKKGFAGDEVFSDMISNIDVLPTILELIGVEIPENVQGESFLSQITEVPNNRQREEIFAEKTYHTTYDPIRCIRTSEYKLIMHFNTYDTVDVPIDAKDSPVYQVMLEDLVKPNEYCELFDLEKDPLEENNLAGKPEFKEILSRLLKQLHQWMIETNDPLLEGPVPSPQYKKAKDILFGKVDFSV